MLKVLIAAGGTGGHLFPAQQLALQLSDCEIFFAGHKLTESPFFDRKFSFVEIVSTASKKKWWTLLKGFGQALKLIWRFQPEVVVGFGSFHAFPVLLAATLLRKKIVLFEANATLGQVNRFFAPFAKKVAFQFPVRHKRAAYVPLLPWKAIRPSGKKYPRDPARTAILVFGGSQGAAFINQTFCEAVQRLNFPVEVIHLTGKAEIDIHYAVPAIVKPYEEDMNAVYEWADLAVCRCGAGTTAELIRYQLPAVLIPYPYAHDHQRQNGAFLKGGARMILQKEATPERLAQEIEQLKNNLAKHKQALREISLPQTMELGELVRAIGGEQ